MDDLLSSESGELRQPGAGEQVLGEAGSSLKGRPPGSHPSAPGVVVRLVMGGGQGIGIAGVTGPQPPAVMRQRQGLDVSCGVCHPLPRGAVAGRVEPKGAKEWVMDTQVWKPQLPDLLLQSPLSPSTWGLFISQSVIGGPGPPQYRLL